MRRMSSPWGLPVLNQGWQGYEEGHPRRHLLITLSTWVLHFDILCRIRCLLLLKTGVPSLHRIADWNKTLFIFSIHTSWVRQCLHICLFLAVIWFTLRLTSSSDTDCCIDWRSQFLNIQRVRPILKPSKWSDFGRGDWEPQDLPLHWPRPCTWVSLKARPSPHARLTFFRHVFSSKLHTFSCFFSLLSFLHSFGYGHNSLLEISDGS